MYPSLSHSFNNINPSSFTLAIDSWLMDIPYILNFSMIRLTVSAFLVFQHNLTLITAVSFPDDMLSRH